MSEMSLRQKLIEVYSKIDFVAKDGRNAAQGYKYVRAVDLVHAVRRALIELNVYVQVEFEQLRAYSYKTAKGSEMNAAEVKCILRFIDGDGDGVTYISVGLGSAADAGDKYSYKAQTGALKYALRNAFLIPDDADPEADESVDEDETAKSKAIRPKSHPSEMIQPPKAEIPDAPFGMSSSDKPLSEEDTDAMRNRFRLLGDDLAAAGLKAAPKLPIARKLLMYLLKTTGATSADQITRTQWNTFWDLVSGVKKGNDGAKALVRLVDAASKPQES